MTVAIVLGNGVSRKEISLATAAAQGTIYGCNALYRDFTPTVLVATDRPIAAVIEQTGYPIKNRFYTRKPQAGLGGYPVPEKYYGYSSGPIATAIAALDNHAKIYLVGFDMGPIHNNGFNNVYVNTEHYRKSSSSPTYTGNWVKQLAKIVHDFPSVQFVRVCGATTASQKDLAGHSNLVHISMIEFLDRINTTKDL